MSDRWSSRKQFQRRTKGLTVIWLAGNQLTLGNRGVGRVVLMGQSSNQTISDRMTILQQTMTG